MTHSDIIHVSGPLDEHALVSEMAVVPYLTTRPIVAVIHVPFDHLHFQSKKDGFEFFLSLNIHYSSEVQFALPKIASAGISWCSVRQPRLHGHV